MTAVNGSPSRPGHSALSAPQVVAKLAQLQGWQLSGDGADLAIEKIYVFNSYLRTIAFVNAVAFMAEHNDHHPDITVRHTSCSVRWRTHAVHGLSLADFACAAKVDALLEQSGVSGVNGSTFG